MTPTKPEYRLMTQQWIQEDRSCLIRFHDVFNDCVEEGWLDHLGIVTAKGQKAIEVYEQKHKNDRVPVLPK